MEKITKIKGGRGAKIQIGKYLYTSQKAADQSLTVTYSEGWTHKDTDKLLDCIEKGVLTYFIVTKYLVDSNERGDYLDQKRILRTTDESALREFIQEHDVLGYIKQFGDNEDLLE